MPKRVPKPDEIKPDTPLRLDVAAALAYPDGSMTASGLRREAGRGRLAIERVAGKDYTTLRAIQEMRERCRVTARAPGSGCSQPGELSTEESLSKPCGSSGTATSSGALVSARAKLRKLSGPSPNTSPTNTEPREPGTGTRLHAKSPTYLQSTMSMAPSSIPGPAKRPSGQGQSWISFVKPRRLTSTGNR